MVNKKSSFVIAAIVTIFCLFVVAWTSCKKNNSSANVCENYICNNNGYCHVDTVHSYHAVCVCPTGYEGTNCETPSVKKYIGQWDVTQKVSGSDSTAFIGVVYKYTAFLQQTATPTTFFIDNVSDNRYYNDIICTLDSDYSSYFKIDTISAYHMVYDHYRILYGGGQIFNNDSISGTFATRHLSPTSNWTNDTFSLTMTLHH